MTLLWISTLLVLLLVGQTLQMYLDSKDYETEYVSFESLETRNANGERILQFKAFNKEYNLLLQPAEIFSPNYRYMEIETLSNGMNAIREREQTILNGKGGQLYSVAETQGSLYIADGEGVILNGIINDELVVAPVSAEDLQSGGASHVIYKKKAEAFVDRSNDYINLFETETLEEMERQNAPSEVTVEVLVVMDNLNTLALNSNQKDIESYAAVFWNSVQRRYAPASNPKVKLAIAGVIAIPSASGQAFITKALSPNDNTAAEGSKMLNGFRDWLKQQGKPFDAAILHTALDGYDGQTGSRAQAGLAFLGTACNDNAAGYGEDKVPLFTGVVTIAHELGHILNSEHDGESTSSSCDPNVHNVMAPSAGPGMPNQWTFSRCSLNSITSYLKSSKGKCTWTAPSSGGVKLSSVLPGFWEKAKSLDEFCDKVHGAGWVQYTIEGKSVCDGVYCNLPGYEDILSLKPAPEGTPCGYNKMCNNGFCSVSEVPSLDQQCAAKFGSGSKAADVFDASACSNLKCTNGQAGAAKEGATCGLAGICRNKQCVGQVSDTLDKVCQNSIRPAGFTGAQTDAEKQRCEFRCVQSRYKDVVKKVPDQLPCGPRSVCQSQRCVAL